jgi:glycosyltransferase involved in cell wall biosynthesis
MRVLIVHNKYGRLSGEEVVVSGIVDLLKSHGHEVHSFFRSSEEIMGTLHGKIKAFFSGIYSFSSRLEIKRLINEVNPDIVHVHNLFPLISPAILPICNKMGIPVVMTVHNYRLICPNGLFMTNGKVCEKCANGREWWCVLKNCESNLMKSLGYALRNYIARKFKLFRDNVTIYATLSEFQRDCLVRASYSPDRICVIPNFTKSRSVERDSPGDYVAFAGRLSPEKGIDILIDTAKACPHIKFKVAGSYERMPDLPQKVPANLELCGHLAGTALQDFFKKSRFLILCSIWYEAFGLVNIEAYAHGKPVICSRIGGLPEVVEDGKTGYLFEPGNTDDFVEKINCLWTQPALCQEMGENGVKKVLEEYSGERYYERLIDAYSKALSLYKYQTELQKSL